MDVGPHFRAKLANFSAKLAIKAPLEAPLGALEAPLGAVGRHLGSKMLPRRPPEAFRPPQTSISIDFRTIFARKLIKNSLFLRAPELLGQSFKEQRVARWRLFAR